MSARSRHAIHLILDFDGTLSCKDTLHLVAKIGYDKQGLPLNGLIRYPLPATSWDAVGGKYMEKYNEHKLHYRPIATERCTLAAETSWLASLRPIEAFGAKTAEETGVFQHVKLADIQRTAKAAVEEQKVQFRPGWKDLLTFVLEGGSCSILSVNWSAAFIRSTILAVLDQSMASAEHDKLSRYVRDYLQVDANEIQGMDDEAGSSGRLRSDDASKDVRTSADKLLRMPKRCQSRAVGHADDPKPDDALVAYCGDSDTDLECLLSADIGICLQDEPKGSTQRALADTLRRLSIDVRPIEDLRSTELRKPGLWSAIDFHQVLKALQSLE